MRKGGGGLGMFTQAGLFNKEDASIFLLIHIWGFGNYMEAVWLWPLEVAVQVVSMVVCFKALPPSLSLPMYLSLRHRIDGQTSSSLKNGYTWARPGMLDDQKTNIKNTVFRTFVLAFCSDGCARSDLCMVGWLEYIFGDEIQ